MFSLLRQSREKLVSCPEHIIITNCLRSNVWKHFEFDTIDGKNVNKGKTVCGLCKMQLPYGTITMTTNWK